MLRIFWRQAGDYFRRFHVQLVLTLVFASLAPIVVALVVNYILGAKIIMDKNDAMLNDNLMLSRINANSVINNYKKALYQIVTDDAFLTYFENIGETSLETAQYARVFDRLQQRMLTNILLSPDVRSVGLVDINSRTLMFSQGRVQDQGMISFFQANAETIHAQAINRTFPMLEVVPSDASRSPEEEGFFYVSHRVYNHETMKFLGSVILFFRPTSLNEAINNKGQAVYQFSEKVILTKDNLILCSKRNLIGGMLTAIPEARTYLTHEGDKKNFYEDGKTIVYRAEIDGYDLHLLEIVDKKRLMSGIWTLWLYTSCAILVSTIISLLIVYFATRKTNHSINHITQLMNSLAPDGDKPSPALPVNSNEIQTIERSFEEMVHRIERLLFENEQQYRRIVTATEASKEAELRSLELQINPHFLFNTIDTINWMAIRKDEYEISKQLTNLAQILRYTVYDVNGVVTVNQELQWMTKYLELQQNRFSFNFEYAIDASPETLDCRIHKLILQPFLENSIIHGFENIDYLGFLRLRLSTKTIDDMKYLAIDIRDNGVGIPDEKAELIKKLLNNPQTECPNAVGIQNMILRLIGYYGSSSTVWFTSAPGETRFVLNIPQERIDAVCIES
ncbi:MAG: histidine kinase [Treponemataceae bacterium]